MTQRRTTRPSSASHDHVERARSARRGSPYLNTEQAAAYLGISPRHFKRMRRQGVGPVYRRHTRFVAYHIDDLDAWSAQLSRQDYQP